MSMVIYEIYFRNIKIKLTSLPETFPISLLKGKISEIIHYKPRDIKLYYGPWLIEDNMLPREYGMSPRDQPWVITVMVPSDLQEISSFKEIRKLY